ncbi:hypothetical protein GCM10027613_30420 [Microlunatus endophyticus]
MLHSFEEVSAVGALLADIWDAPPEQPPIDLSMVLALAHSGGYVVGAYQDGDLVGASVGFVGGQDRDELHSHITGVRKDRMSTGIGFTIKQHQRNWALERGLTTITWTFDPLIARNAYFNLTRLGGRIAEYLINFYGPMDDGLNLGQPSDRAFVRWDLAAERTPPAAPVGPARVILDRAPDGSPVWHGELIADDPVELIIPADIETMRQQDPALALRWRLALRHAITALLDEGWAVTGFRRGGGFLVAPWARMKTITQEDRDERRP